MLNTDKLIQRMSIATLISSNYSALDRSFTAIRFRIRSRFEYSLYINAKDPLIVPVLSAIMKQQDVSTFKSVLAITPWSYGKGFAKEFDFLMYLKTSVDVVINGHKINVGLGDEFDLGSSDTPSDQKSSGSRPTDVRFICKSAKAREDLIAFLKEVARKEAMSEKHPKLYTTGSWGDWDQCGDLSLKPLDSVVLAGTQLEDIVADIKLFFDSEDTYATRGIPWHRGYLFYGPPGTGKSSLALALANHFKCDLYSLSLNDLNKDSHLVSHVNNMDPGSILVLEDIDVQAAPTNHEDAGKKRETKVTLSSLLNVLDGITSPHGIVTILTTNHIDKLDESLLRKGRIDARYELSYLTQDQLHRLYAKMCGVTVFDIFPSVEGLKITPADACSVIKDCNYLAQGSYSALVEMITSRQGANSGQATTH
jgi:hypothetical protein